MLMDISSEMIHALLPVFMVSVLGAGALAVGLVEGVGEATASIVKLFSGALSDRLGKRKMLVALGYGLGAVSKPLFALAPTVGWVLAARFSDRVGKGIRGAPRDALIADATPADQRGAAFGLRQALDTVGALAGPLIAIGLLALFAGDMRAVFWCAIIPGIAAVAVLILFVREPPRAAPVAAAPRASRPRLRLRDLAALGRPFWAVTLLGVVFTLARFSEAFLVLRAQGVGLDLAWVPLVLVVMNAVYAVTAYPAGAYSDRVDRRVVLAVGLAVLIAADLVLALASGVFAAFAGIALWGLHMGLTQGLFSALVADTAPTERRATAFGWFNLVSGVVLLLASLVAGALWQWAGPAATFYAGAVFAALALVGLAAWLVRRAPS
ncbi:MAG TPA: MFS transporter [Alphaproteobacteria bacterium]